MVNLISDIVVNSNRGNSSFVTLMLDRPQKSQASNTVDKNNSRKKYVLPAGLLSAGGILLYFGLRNPSKNKLFNNHIKNQIFGMEKKVYEFTAFVRNSIEDIAQESSVYIRKYKASHHINPVEYSSQLKVFRRPEKIAEAQDLSFEAIESRTNFGMDDIRKFSSMYTGIKNIAEEKVINKKKIVKSAIGHERAR